MNTPNRNLPYFITLVATLLLSSLLLGETPIFKEQERIRLHLDDEMFSYISEIDPVPDGYILLLSASKSGHQKYLLKVDLKGRVVSRYDKYGNGPGEARLISNVVVSGDSIYAIETSSPYIHEFDLNLKFKADHRIKLGGNLWDLGDFFGVWGSHTQEINGKIHNFFVALYDKKNLDFKGYFFETDFFPPAVFNWGGFCQLDNGSFAAICVHQYSIRLYNEKLQKTGDLISKIPNHIKRYKHLKGHESVFNEKTLEWVLSWSKMHSIFSLGDKLLLIYRINNKTYLDIYSNKGEPLILNRLFPNGLKINFTSGNILYRTHWDNENDDKDSRIFWLVKEKLTL